MSSLRASLLLIGASIFAVQAHAALFTWSTTLTGDQENPPSGSTATGFGTVKFDDATRALQIDLSWSGLTSIALQAHIHCCVAPPGNVGIALDLWLSDAPRPTTGSYSATYDLDTDNPFRTAFVTANGGTTLAAFDALRAAMDIQHAYYNVHTTTFPGGEIRGNLAPFQVPEPSTLLLLGLAGAALAYRRTRK